MKFEKTTNMTFEQAAKELEEISHKLENSAVGLDDAVALFARGNELKQFCDNKLQNAKMQVEKIITEGEKITKTVKTDLN